MKLNIGAGKDIREGWTNADIVLLPGIDVLLDIDSVWPWDDDSCDEMVGRAVIEHSRDKMHFIEEMWRVAKHGCEIMITSCPFTAPDAWADPTHRSPMHWQTFDFFHPAHPYNYYSPARFITTKVCQTALYLAWELRAYKWEDPALAALQVDTWAFRGETGGEWKEAPKGATFGVATSREAGR